MTIKNKTYFALAVVVIAVLGIIATILATRPSATVGDSGIPNYFKTMSTSTGITVATNTSTALLATSTARIYAYIVNAGSNAVYLGFNGSAATVGSGVYLAASSSYEISAKNLYVGAVNAIASGGTSVVTVVANQ